MKKIFLDHGRDGMGGTFSVGNLSIPCFSTLHGQCNQKMTKTHINFNNTSRTSWDVGSLRHVTFVAFICLLQEFQELRAL